MVRLLLISKQFVGNELPESLHLFNRRLFIRHDDLAYAGVSSSTEPTLSRLGVGLAGADSGEQRGCLLIVLIVLLVEMDGSRISGIKLKFCVLSCESWNSNCCCLLLF